MLGASLDVQVRRARIADAPELAEIFAGSWRTTYRGVIPHNHLENMIRRRGTARWRSSIRAGEMVLLIEYEGKNVGYATCGTARSRGRTRARSTKFTCCPTIRASVSENILFEACRYRLDERRLKGLIVWALAENAGAVNFYWQLGGRPLVSSYERIGGVRLEKIAFAWDYFAPRKPMRAFRKIVNHVGALCRVPSIDIAVQHSSRSKGQARLPSKIKNEGKHAHRCIQIGNSPPDDINVVVEVPVGGEPIKYELDKASGTLVVDRFLYTPMRYPGNYGFVPHTLSADGDPIDVLVCNTRAIAPGAVMNCRPVGVLSHGGRWRR